MPHHANRTSAFPPPVASTGLPGLDKVLRGIEPGDNIVWEVETTEDYREFIAPYVAAANAAGRHLVYFRFAPHAPLLPANTDAEVHQFDCATGFEPFVRQIHDVIEAAGRGAIYVFDSLTHLADTWGSDQSLGNFFALTCPRLRDLHTVTYFGLLRDRHSDYAMETIRKTTQFLLDVFRLDGRMYVRPVKVQHRSRDAMNTIHVRDGEAFLPVRDSAVLAQILSRTHWPRLQTERRVGHWRRLFTEAHTVARDWREGKGEPRRYDEMLRRVRWALRVHRSGIAPPLVMDRAYVNGSLDVFPMEFLEMRLIHETVFGEDILAGLAIDPRDLRHQCEREVKSRLIGLRLGYLRALGEAKALAESLSHFLSGYQPLANGILALLGKEPPRRRGETFAALAAAVGPDAAVFTEMLAVKEGRSKPDAAGMRDLFERCHHATERLGRIIDEIP